MPRGVSKRVHVALLPRALYGTLQAIWLWQKAVDRALKELDVVHLVVALGTHGSDDFLSEGEPELPGYAGRGSCTILRREVSGSYWVRIPGRKTIPQEVCVVER